MHHHQDTNKPAEISNYLHQNEAKSLQIYLSRLNINIARQSVSSSITLSDIQRTIPFLAHLLFCNLIIMKFLKFSATYFSHIIMFNSHLERNSHVDPNFFLKPFKLSVSDISQQSFTSQCDILRDDYESSKILTFFTHLPYPFDDFICRVQPALSQDSRLKRTELLLQGSSSVASSALACLLCASSRSSFKIKCHVSALDYVEMQFIFPQQEHFFFFQVPVQQFLSNFLTTVEY